MKKLTGFNIPMALFLLMFASIPIQGCSTSDTGGFAIFLTENDTPPAEMPSIDKIQLADQPLISMKDIVTYNMQTYELKVTAGAFERICNMEVPVRGRTFVVCRNRNPVYWGAFWTPVSSISFDGITIWKPYSKDLPRILTLELGYPASSFYSGEDPRNSPELISALELTGKLVRALTLNTVKELPGSMKGYELYSWQQNGDWHFTLITGTNRNKTTNEIISDGDYISEAGWIKIQLTGIDSLKAALDKLPRGAEIFWLAGPRAPVTPGSTSAFALPSSQSIVMMIEYAKSKGLKLSTGYL